MNSQTQLKIEPFDAIPSTEKPYAEVVFNLPLRDPFTYIIPPKLLGKVRVGMRVLVPFGRRRITGYVVNLVEKWDKPIALKTIAELPDLEPIVSEEILSLTRWLADYYQSAWGEAISSALPAGLDKTSYQLVKAVRLASNLPTEEEITDLLKRSPKQKSVFDLVRQKEINLAELETLIPGGKSALRSLKEKKLVEVFTEKKERQALVPEGTMDQPFGSHLTFTPEQEAVFNEISSTIDAGKFQSFLLHGITGSGKTEVYIRCIQRILEMDKTAIMMVPEISLTPQTVKRFRQRFGDRVAILHSGLSQTERYLEWKKIYEIGRASCRERV